MSEDLRAVAAAIFSPDEKRVLSILRANDQSDSLAGFWGLPAVSHLKTEEEIDAAKRIGPEKLGTPIIPVERLGELQGERALGILTLGLWRCDMTDEPDFAKRVIIPGKSQYVVWEWKKPEELVTSASSGSLCSGVLLNHLNIPYGKSR